MNLSNLTRTEESRIMDYFNLNMVWVSVHMFKLREFGLNCYRPDLVCKIELRRWWCLYKSIHCSSNFFVRFFFFFFPFWLKLHVGLFKFAFKYDFLFALGLNFSTPWVFARIVIWQPLSLIHIISFCLFVLMVDLIIFNA